MELELTYTDITDSAVNAGLTDKLTAVLPEYFGVKVRSTGNEHLKRQRMAGALLLAYALAKRGCAAEDIRISEGPQGKPLLDEPEGLYFSLSHSGDMVMLAVCDRETGCDIQKVRDGGDIPSRFFTDGEKKALVETGEASRPELFTRIWARKESYVKATGEGLKRDLHSFCVLDGCTPPGYIFSDRLLCGYAAAVCIQAEEGAERPAEGAGDICFLPFQNLVNVIL